MVGCLSPAVSIAATMNVRTPFLSGGDEDVRRRVDQAKVYHCYYKYKKCIYISFSIFKID